MSGNEITFRRSIFGRNKYISGTYDPTGQGLSKKIIHSLLRDADSALDKKPGYFFDTVETNASRQIFVFGFDKEEIRKNGRNEEYFDLYTQLPDRVEPLSLERLYEKLRRYTQENDISSLGEEVNANSEDEIDDQVRFNRASLERTQQRRMSLPKLSHFWEHLRGEGTVKITLSELDQFVATVSGSLQHVGFVEGTSPQTDHSRPGVPGDPSGFPCVAGEPESAEDPPDLSEWIDDESNIQWGDLPTYEDELRRLKRSKRESVGNRRPYTRESRDDHQSQTLGEALDEKLEETIGERWEVLAKEIFDDVADRGLREDGDSSLPGRVLGAVSRNSGEDLQKQVETIREEGNLNEEPETIERASPAGVEGASGVVKTNDRIRSGLDDDLEREIAQRVLSEFAHECKQDVMAEIEPQLREELNRLVWAETHRLLRRVIEEADAVRSSRAYRRAREDN